MSMDILFVCTGNTCRSPMAEVIFNSLSQNMKAESRGIAAGASQPASVNSVLAVKEFGIDLENHMSRQLTVEDLQEYKYIITMTSSQKDMLRAYSKNDNIMTLAEFAKEAEDVSDPYGGNEEIYKKTANQIFRYIAKGIIKRSECIFAEEKDVLKITQMEKEYFPDYWSENSVKTQVDNKKVIVLKNGEDIIGYCIFMMAADEGEILRIATGRKMRKSGAGKKLLMFAIDYMKNQGCREVYLEVRASNSSAIALYESVGFENIGIRKGYYHDNGEDASLYKLEIKER